MTRSHHVRDHETVAVTRRVWLQRIDAAGLCRSCAARPARPGLHSCVECGAKSAAKSKADRARSRRAVGCRKCGATSHTTKTCGRERYGGGLSGKAIVRLGPVVRKRLGVETVVPVISSWQVNS